MLFAQITDMHLGHRLAQPYGVDIRKNLITVLEDIQRRGIKDLVCTGDIAEDEEAPWFFQTIKEYGFQMHLVLGNHDTLSVMELHKEHLHANQYYYKIPSEEAVLLFCDTKEAYLGEEQLCWLIQEIESSMLPVLIFIHHPVLDCDNSYMDQKYALKNREEVKSALKATNTAIHLFCGHYHTADERSDGTIHQYITPSVFYQFKKYAEKLEKEDEPFGYRIIRVGKEILTEVVTFP